MAELSSHPFAENRRNYAGTHCTTFKALQALNHLKPVNLSNVAMEDRVCAICTESMSASQTDQTWHHIAVQLPGCGHCFGKSCLINWLTPLDQEGVISEDQANELGENDEDGEEFETANSAPAHASWVGSEEGSRTASGWTPINENTSISSARTSATRHDRIPERVASLEDPLAAADPCPNEANVDQEVGMGLNYVSGVDQPLGESSNEVNQQHNQITTERQQQKFSGVTGRERNAAIAGYVDFLFASHVDFMSKGLIEHLLLLRQHRPPAERSRRRGVLAGLVFTALVPGSNTCPLCRADVFLRETSPDSLLFLRTRLRVWDIAYELAHIKRTPLEEHIRTECLDFIDTMDSIHRGTHEPEQSLTYAEQRWAFNHAIKSIIDLDNQPDTYFPGRWTDEQRKKLWVFGTYLNYTERDLSVLFGRDTRADDIRKFAIDCCNDWTRWGDLTSRLTEDYPDGHLLDPEEDISLSETED